MRYLLFFLLMNVSCLALQPALNLIISGEIPQYCSESCHAEEKHSCDSHDHEDSTTHHHHDSDENQDKTGCVHSCNPLLACGCCSVVPVSGLALYFYSDPLFTVENILFKEAFPKSIAIDFWHPPQIV